MASATGSSSWMEDATWSVGTSPPPEETASTGSPVVLAAVIIGALATMSLLFSFALLIDCRNQQAEEAKKQSHVTRAGRIKRQVFRLPTFFRGRGVNEDNMAFASHLCEENRHTNPVSTGNSTTVVEITESTPSSSSIQC